MNLRCPKCDAINDSVNANAGLLQCHQCGEWFHEPRPAAFVHGGVARPVPTARTAHPANFIWPAVLIVSIIVGALGLVPMLFAAIGAIMSILGSIVSLLAKSRA